MELIENYNKALQAIYDHVGFTEDWVVYPIDDRTNKYWKILGDDKYNQHVVYHETIEVVKTENGNHYEDSIYTQRFYEKWIYEGSVYTMIFCDTHVDGMKYLAVFENAKRVKDDNH